jgi:hypothetical protein
MKKIPRREFIKVFTNWLHHDADDLDLSFLAADFYGAERHAVQMVNDVLVIGEEKTSSPQC